MEILNLKGIRKIINYLRSHKEKSNLDERSKGLIGNIIGELKILENNSLINQKELTNEAKEIIFLWKTDPVIQAYLNQRSSLEKRISDLETEINSIESELEGPNSPHRFD